MSTETDVEVLADNSLYVESANGHDFVVQCGRCHTLETVSNHLKNRGGGYECGVYVCESKDMDEKKHLLKPEIYYLNVEQLEELGESVMNCVSDRMRSLRTNGDGSCGMHALFGTPVFASVSNAYELNFFWCSRNGFTAFRTVPRRSRTESRSSATRARHKNKFLGWFCPCSFTRPPVV